MPTEVIGEGKSEYIYIDRENADNKIIVKQDDDPRLNSAGNEIESEDKIYARHPDLRGRFELQSSKLAPIIENDARAEQKLEDVS